MLMMLSSRATALYSPCKGHPSTSTFLCAPLLCRRCQSSSTLLPPLQQRLIHSTAAVPYSCLATEVAKLRAVAPPSSTSSSSEEEDAAAAAPLLKINMYQMTDEELTSYLVDIMGQPKYRSKQIRTCK